MPAPPSPNCTLEAGGNASRAARPVGMNVAGARIDVLTAFEHDGARARFGQRQRGEQTGGAETDDDQGERRARGSTATAGGIGKGKPPTAGASRAAIRFHPADFLSVTSSATTKQTSFFLRASTLFLLISQCATVL